MRKRIKFFIIFFLFVLTCYLHTKSMAAMDCQSVSNDDVMYVNATLTDFNFEEYNEYQRGMNAKEYYSKSWEERYVIDKNAMLFGSIDAKCEGGMQNGYLNENVYGSYFGVLQGLAKDKLVNGNLCIVEDYTNGTSFFPTARTNPYIYNEVLSNWKFPFIKESSGYYTFNSDNYHVYRDYDTKTFQLHKGKRNGFFPFNNCDDNTFMAMNRNLAFSAKIEIPFIMTLDGKIINKDTNEKEDMIFNFSGDDDVWVYVDDKLILDLGGCHNKMSGSINFAKNQVYYERIYQSDQDNNEFDVYKTAFKNGMLPKGEHTLSVFYIERSGGEANLAISFNLQKGSVEAQYVDKNTNEILSKETYNGPTGKTVTTNAKNIDGYTLVKKPENENFTITADTQIVKYYYAKNTKVIAKYIDEVTKNEISDMVVINGKYGDKYESTQKNISGYDFTKIEGYPSGTMKGEPINIIYYYKHKAKIIVNYIDKNSGKLLDKEEVFFHEGDIFSPKIRLYEEYKLIESPQTEKIIVKREEIELNYYYVLLKSNLQIEMNLDKAYINGYYYGLDNKVEKIETDIIGTNNDDSIKIFYTIKVTNNGEKIGNGYITFIIPEGFTMQNVNWVIDSNIAKYKVTDLNIGETREYQVVIQKSKKMNTSGNIKAFASIDSDKLQEITLEDNKDMNELAIMPRTGGKSINVIPIILILTAIAILIAIKIKCNKSKRKELYEKEN